jgi:hypothetical protein
MTWVRRAYYLARVPAIYTEEFSVATAAHNSWLAAATPVG